MRHLDVMDLLAMYSPQNSAPLDAVARLCGVPGKLGLDGWQAYAQFLAHEIEAVRRCCETYVMNTHLVCCRFQKMRGGFTEAAHHQEIAYVKETLNNLAPAKSHRYG
jgi:predicted PolB exonuclease-like 3'-5' exonuclease